MTINQKALIQGQKSFFIPRGQDISDSNNFGFCLQKIWIIAGECKTRSPSQKSAEFRNESTLVKGRLETRISKPNYSY